MKKRAFNSNYRQNSKGGGHLRTLKIPTIFILIILLGIIVFPKKKELILQEQKEENTLAIYLEDEQINYIPEKDSGYTLDLTKSSCTNGVTIGFDYNTWSVKTNYSNYTNTDNTRVKCSLYFKKRTFAESLVDCGALSKDAGTCIKENYYLTEEVVDDETVDNNLRFIGANPENYVWFNEELWRIIGVMNNIDDGNGNKETRLKIIRDEPIGEYGWDYKSDGTYSNDWTTSTLMNLLNNGAYYNRTTGSYYNHSLITAVSVDFSTTGLTSDAKSMIGNVLWNLGGTASHTTALASDWYGYERGTIVYSGHANEWTGSIGLMYPSDYGYATSGGSITNRETCLNTELYDWSGSSVSNCKNNNWLHDSSNTQWTLTPYYDDSSHVFFVGPYGGVDNINAYYASTAVSPALYLSSNVRISGGTGEESDPFTLSL